MSLIIVEALTKTVVGNQVPRDLFKLQLGLSHEQDGIILCQKIDNLLIVRHSIFITVQILCQHVSCVYYFIIAGFWGGIDVNAKYFGMFVKSHAWVRASF